MTSKWPGLTVVGLLGLCLLAIPESASACYECDYDTCEAEDPGDRGRNECEDYTKCVKGTCFEWCELSGGSCWGDEGPPRVLNLPGVEPLRLCRSRAFGSVIRNGEALLPSPGRAGSDREVPTG